MAHAVGLLQHRRFVGVQRWVSRATHMRCLPCMLVISGAMPYAHPPNEALRTGRAFARGASVNTKDSRGRILAEDAARPRISARDVDFLGPDLEALILKP